MNHRDYRTQVLPNLIAGGGAAYTFFFQMFPTFEMFPTHQNTTVVHGNQSQFGGLNITPLVFAKNTSEKLLQDVCKNKHANFSVINEFETFETFSPVACSPVACSPVACSPVACSPVACSPVACSPVDCAPVACSPVACSPVECSPVACTPVACPPQQECPECLASQTWQGPPLPPECFSPTECPNNGTLPPKNMTVEDVFQCGTGMLQYVFMQVNGLMYSLIIGVASAIFTLACKFSSAVQNKPDSWQHMQSFFTMMLLQGTQICFSCYFPSSEFMQTNWFACVAFLIVCFACYKIWNDWKEAKIRQEEAKIRHEVHEAMVLLTSMNILHDFNRYMYGLHTPFADACLRKIIDQYPDEPEHEVMAALLKMINLYKLWKQDETQQIPWNNEVDAQAMLLYQFILKLHDFETRPEYTKYVTLNFKLQIRKAYAWKTWLQSVQFHCNPELVGEKDVSIATPSKVGICLLQSKLIELYDACLPSSSEASSAAVNADARPPAFNPDARPPAV
jgi:hypothetical protein